MKQFLVILLSLSIIAGCTKKEEPVKPVTIFDGEKHFSNTKQLTFGGQNAEAYFSYNADKLIFQTTRDNLECDAIYMMNSDGSEQEMISTGEGATTCAIYCT